MSLLQRFRTGGAHTRASSPEERATLRESLDIMVDHAVRERLRTAVAEVDAAITVVRAGLTSEPTHRTSVGAALDGLLDVRQTLARRLSP